MRRRTEITMITMRMTRTRRKTIGTTENGELLKLFLTDRRKETTMMTAATRTRTKTPTESINKTRRDSSTTAMMMIFCPVTH